jgi:DNA recombination protein RmuC
MQTSFQLSLAFLIVGVSVGWGLAAWLGRQRADRAVAEARTAIQSEHAALVERARASDQRATDLDALLRNTQVEAGDWRARAEEAARGVTRLEERTGRVEALERSEAELRGLETHLRQELANLGANAASETSRLKGELTAEREYRERLGSECAAAESELNACRAVTADLRETIGRILAEAQSRDDSLARLTGERDEARTLLAEVDASARKLSEELIDVKVRAEKDRQGFADQLEAIANAKAALTDQFKSLANEILEDKSKRFAEQNQQSLGGLLEPLRARITEFQGKVEEVYFQESKDRSALQEQVRQLLTLNRALGEEAKNLTHALKGSSKAQGHWGELILDRVLELSGLRKGIEYVAQKSEVRDDGTRATPDVVINLPEDRRIVVDAKVSLLAYERYSSSDDEAERALHLKAHIDSVRGHIKLLSEKRYHALYDNKSLDFVIAFVPVEPAFMLAVSDDQALFQDAWDKNVLLVSPSTLLFVVRTVAHLWRQEAQSKNAQDIAKRGAELYDKLVGFVGDLQTIGARLKQAQDAYALAENKLATGRGSVIRQAEMLRALGVKPTKSIPANLLVLSEPVADLHVTAPRPDGERSTDGDQPAALLA